MYVDKVEFKVQRSASNFCQNFAPHQDSDLALQPYSLMTLHAKLLQAFKLGVIHVLGFTDYQSTG